MNNNLNSILNFSATNWYGVDFVPSAIPHKWRAQIQDEGEEFTIGFFQSKIQAGLAVNRFCAEQGLPLQIPLLQNENVKERLLKNADGTDQLRLTAAAQMISKHSPLLKINRSSEDKFLNRIVQIKSHILPEPPIPVKLQSKNSSKYFGVKTEANGFWSASLNGNNIGLYETEHNAAIAVNRYCMSHHLAIPNMSIFQESFSKHPSAVKTQDLHIGGGDFHGMISPHRQHNPFKHNLNNNTIPRHMETTFSQHSYGLPTSVVDDFSNVGRKRKREGSREFSEFMMDFRDPQVETRHHTQTLNNMALGGFSERMHHVEHQQHQNKRKHHRDGGRLSKKININTTTTSVDTIFEERYCVETNKKWWMVEAKGVQAWMDFEQICDLLIFEKYCRENMDDMAVQANWIGQNIFARIGGMWKKGTIVAALDQQNISFVEVDGKSSIFSLNGNPGNIFFFEKITPLLNLDGYWQLPMTKNGMQLVVQIMGCRIIWENNPTFSLSFLGKIESVFLHDQTNGNLSFQLGDKNYTGKIMNNNCIIWNGNESWIRISKRKRFKGPIVTEPTTVIKQQSTRGPYEICFPTRSSQRVPKPNPTTQDILNKNMNIKPSSSQQQHKSSSLQDLIQAAHYVSKKKYNNQILKKTSSQKYCNLNKHLGVKNEEEEEEEDSEIEEEEESDSEIEILKIQQRGKQQRKKKISKSLQIENLNHQKLKIENSTSTIVLGQGGGLEGVSGGGEKNEEEEGRELSFLSDLVATTTSANKVVKRKRKVQNEEVHEIIKKRVHEIMGKEDENAFLLDALNEHEKKSGNFLIIKNILDSSKQDGFPSEYRKVVMESTPGKKPKMHARWHLFCKHCGIVFRARPTPKNSRYVVNHACRVDPCGKRRQFIVGVRKRRCSIVHHGNCLERIIKVDEFIL